MRADPDLVRISDERAESYRRLGWWRAETVDALALRFAASSPDTVAVVSGERGLTYGELAAAVRRTAGRLAGLGIRPGEPVLVQLPNDLEFVVLVLACVRLGAPPVLAMPALRELELEHVVRTVRPVAMAVPRSLRRFDHLALAQSLRGRHASLRTLLVAGDDGAGETDLLDVCWGPGASAGLELPAPPDPRDLALFLLSSGTTGAPKAIARTHEDYGCAIRSSSAVSGLDQATRFLALMPVAHSFSFGHPGILGVLAHGGRVVLGAPDNPRQAFDLIARERITHSALVPALVTQWLAASATAEVDLSSLRVLQVGGARLAPTTAKEALAGLGCQIQQVYGMSEGLLNYTRLDDPEETITSTQGRPCSPGDELRILDSDGADVPTGRVGELLTRGPYTIAGYYREPPAVNAAAFTADGFYRTGDLVRLDETGNLTVAGRVKDVINRGGEKISSEELESLVLQYPGIQAAAVVAMPHPAYGEAVCLYTVSGGGQPPRLTEIRRFLETRGLARFKLPERLEVVDALPMIGVGKINKRQLRDEIATKTAAERPGCEIP